MFKFNRLVCVVLVCAIAGVAFGAAIKIKAFDWVHEENPEGDGMAIMNYHQGNNQTEITAAITDFLPSTEYKVTIHPGPRFDVTTNPAGNSTSHGFVLFDVCQWNEFGVDMIVWRDDNGDDFRQVDEERARGHVDCP